MNYKIRPLFLGSKEGDKSDSLYLYPQGEKYTACYCCYLVEGEGAKYLVDAGLPEPSCIQDKPFAKLKDAVSLREALLKADTHPEEIQAVILTHLHYDHSFNLAMFPQARVYVQRRELAYALTPLPCERRIYSLLKECGRPGWLDGVDRFEILDGDAQIAPGIRAILTPGHSPGSQSIAVDTAAGTYILTGDCIPIYDNFEKCIPNTIHNDLFEWYASCDKLRACACALLPGHDMRVFDHAVYGEVDFRDERTLQSEACGGQKAKESAVRSHCKK